LIGEESEQSFEEDGEVQNNEMNQLFANFLTDENQPLPELRKIVIDADDADEIDKEVLKDVTDAFYKYLEEKGYSVLNKE